MSNSSAMFDAEFSDTGALRQRIGRDGRAHVDRWLPLLVLHREVSAADGLARRVAVNSSAYCVWSPDEDEKAFGAIEAIVQRMADKSGRVLVISLDDQPIVAGPDDAPSLPPFAVYIERAGGPGSARAAKTFGTAMSGVEIDLRRCTVNWNGTRPLPADLEQRLARIDGVERLSVSLPQIHRRHDGGVFPALTHDLAAASGDSLLRAACAFVDDGSKKAPHHYRSLGRSAYLAAALKADRKLDAIAQSFDFLLSISPINTTSAREEFLAGGGETPPHFQYRPLSVDPDIAKRELYAIDLDVLEDPLLEHLLNEKRREIDAQLTMLGARNTPAFRPASMILYGAVDAALLADAREILASSAKDPPRGRAIGAQAIAAAARDLINQYRTTNEAFDAQVDVREDVSGLLVSGPKLMIAADAAVPASRLDALLAHEVSVHLLTYFNGAAQGLGIFRTGLAGYEGVQEGLGVFAEWASGGLTRTRLRLLAGRVVAVEAMQHGAGFIEVWRLLTHDHGFTPGGAFGITARVFRSGGLAKDAIYLRGFKAVIDLVAEGISLDPFWIGKIAPGHVPAIEELQQRGLVHAPIFRPAFLSSDAARARISRLRGGSSLETMLCGGPAPC